VWILLGAAAVLALVLVTRGATGATASVLGRGALGWRGLARVLENRGIEPVLVDRALEHRDPVLEPPPAPGEHAPPPATLILGFPWQRGGAGWNPAPVLGFVERGGRLVVATSSGGMPGWAEDSLLDGLGVDWESRPRAGALRPLRWWRERRAGDQWPAGPEVPWADPLLTGALGAVARPPAAAAVTALAVDAAGEPVASVFQVGAGEVWLVPSEALANAYLGAPGNAALALALADRLTGPVLVDEYHHGLLSAEAQLAEPAGRAFDAVVLQLGLLWGLAVLAFAWRFGPAWPAPAQRADAHRAFLVGLGALHHRLGHEREAARALVRRAAVYDPVLAPPEQLAGLLERAETAPLLELARELSRSRSHAPPGAPR
jgi:hypothetical protein